MNNKIKRLKEDQYRVIRISKEALFELVYETVNDNLEAYFDLMDCTTVSSHHQLSDDGDYLCVVSSEYHLLEDIDLEELLDKMPDTTESMFNPERYKSLSLNEIRKILSNGKSPMKKD